MKILLLSSVVLLASSCANVVSKPKTLDKFDAKVNCTPKSLVYMEQDFQKDKRSVTEQIKSRERFRNLIKTKLDAVQSCYLKDAPKYTQIDYNYNVCMVVEINEEYNVSFLEIEDNANPLPQSVSKCLYDIFELMNYNKAGKGGVYSTSFKFQQTL